MRSALRGARNTATSSDAIVPTTTAVISTGASAAGQHGGRVQRKRHPEHAGRQQVQAEIARGLSRRATLRAAAPPASLPTTRSTT